jgi:hypothetical protein
MNSARKARNPCFSLTAFPTQKTSGTHEQYITFSFNQTAANCVLIKTQPRSQTGSMNMCFGIFDKTFGVFK